MFILLAMTTFVLYIWLYYLISGRQLFLNPFTPTVLVKGHIIVEALNYYL